MAAVIYRTPVQGITVIRQGNLPSDCIQSNVSDKPKLFFIQIYTGHGLDHCSNSAIMLL